MDDPNPKNKIKTWGKLTKQQQQQQDENYYYTQKWKKDKKQKKIFKNSEQAKALQRASKRLEVFFEAKTYGLQIVFGRTSLPDNISNQDVSLAIGQLQPSMEWLGAQLKSYQQMNSIGKHVQAMVKWNRGTREFKNEFMRILTIRNSEQFHADVAKIGKQRGTPLTKSELLGFPYRYNNSPKTTLPLMDLWESMPRLDRYTIFFSGKSGRVEKYDLGLYKAIYNVLEGDAAIYQNKMPSWITAVPTATSWDFCTATNFSTKFMGMEISDPEYLFNIMNFGRIYVTTPENEKMLAHARRVEKQYPFQHPFNATKIMMRLHCPKGLPALSMDTIWQKIGSDGYMHNIDTKYSDGTPDHSQNREGLRSDHVEEGEIVLPPYLKYTLLDLTFMRIPTNQDEEAHGCMVPISPTDPSLQPSDISAAWGAGSRLLVADIKVDFGFWPKIKGQ